MQFSSESSSQGLNEINIDDLSSKLDDRMLILSFLATAIKFPLELHPTMTKHTSKQALVVPM